jgi:hypothetical protein
VYAAFFFAYGRYFESDPMTTTSFVFKDSDLPLPRITVKGMSEKLAHTNSMVGLQAVQWRRRCS